MLSPVATATAQTLLYDNGSIVTHPAGGAGGVDGSALDNTATFHTPHNIYGFGAQAPPLANNSLADDFTVCGTWTVSDIELFGYATGVAPPSTTLAYIQIWNGDPRNATSSVIWGNLTTNLLSGTTGSLFAYRALIGVIATDTNRQVQRVRVPIPAATPLTLTPGTYWIEFQVTGINFVPPVSENEVNDTGNGLQRQTATWVVLNNAIAPNTAGCAVPFRFLGSAVGQVLASASTYGVGKSGSSGIGGWNVGSPVRNPVLGRDYPMRLINGFAGSSPIVALGTVFGSGFPFPPIGTIYVNPIITTISMPAFNNANTSTLRLPIPHGANLCNLTLGAQAFWGDPGASGSIGHSDGLQLTLGN